jgi:sporulation protein YlmC with PRC-barrel domain
VTVAGKALHAQLHLLDRQLIDQASGALLGKVDDVELDLDADPPVVSALVSGRVRIPARQVMEIDTAVKIVPGELNLTSGDDWVEKHIIDKIPGAGHAPE